MTQFSTSNQSNRVSVCIVSHNAYRVITGRKTAFIGGVERQTSLLAKELVRRGHIVTFVTWDEGGEPEENVEGVRILKVCSKSEGLPGVRFFHPKWTGLTTALRKANADVYYHNCGECVTGQIALWCHRNGKSFVFSAASDADCDPALPELDSNRERLLYRYGLRKANRVIAQSETQRSRFETNFGVDAEVIPMPCPGPSEEEFVVPSVELKRVLWVGRVRQVKRPDRLVKIADACPDIVFDLVGPAYDDEYSQSTAEEARSRPNITVHGAIPREKMADLYRNASLLCCTSDYEGFPNTFLEAWSHGLPVVSTVDPDGVITRKKLGLIGKNADSLSASIRTLIDTPSTYSLFSKNARHYYRENHTMEAVIPRVERILEEVVTNRVQAL